MCNEHKPVAIIVEFHDGIPVASYMKCLNRFERLWYWLIRRRIKPVAHADPVTCDLGILISRELYRRLITCDAPVYKAQQQFDTGLVQAKFVVADYAERGRQEPPAV